MENKKVSIAIANYNNEKYIKKLLDCLIEQSYKNLEIIVVNDASPGDCDSIIEKYQKKDDRIKYVKHEKNKGLFHARLSGAEAATGDYISFLDADDYVSYDYYRKMVEKAEETDSDIVMGNIVLEYDNGKQEYYNLFQTNYNELSGNEPLDEYFRQQGYNFSWHTGCNQLYKMDIWKKAEPHYKKIDKRLLMTEDFAFSTVLFYYAHKVTKVDYECLFYCKHEVTSTSIDDINFTKERNNINDLITSFGFVEEFLKEKNILKKYKSNFENWKSIYANMHKEYVVNSKRLNKKEKQELYKLLDIYCEDIKPLKSTNAFSSIASKWDKRLNEVKKSISNPDVKVVSFDMFDTLIFRPFLYAYDLFELLDIEYRKEVNYGIDFSKMRYLSEIKARNTQFVEDNKIEEVTIEQIYRTIGETYGIESKLLESLMEKELKLEIEMCYRRNTAYDLYKLAINLGKKVIVTSDIYLPEKTIKEILKKNGYNEFDKIYLSSSIFKTKATGNLYEYVLNDLKIKPSEMIHIGDNVYSDVDKSKEKGIKSIYFPKASNIFLDSKCTNSLGQMFNTSMPFWFDNKEAMSFIGIRSMLAVVANKYFDNPFRPFNKHTDFNADPFLIGYYCLGMNLFGISNWLLKNTCGKNDKISFMARDGYLVMEAYKKLSSLYNKVPKIEYMYVSRRALIPVMIKNKLDIYRLTEIVNYEKHSPKSVEKYLKDVVDIKQIESVCKKNNINYSEKFKDIETFNSFLKIIGDELFDEKKQELKRDKLKKYFMDIIGDNPAVFDVGYSGRPEFYIGDLCKKNIDTYFLNINSDMALKYSNNRFNLYTYYDYKPTITGNAYELLISKNAPSCIGYDLNSNKVNPIFEEYCNDYASEYIIETIQKASLEFIDDIMQLFNRYLPYLYYQNNSINIPYFAYLNASRKLDKEVLGCINFEDNIKSNESVRMIDSMEDDLRAKNQYLLPTLVSGELYSMDDEPMKVGNLYYNPFVDLNKKGKLKRLLYYVLFDKKTLKRRIKETKNSK